MTQRLDAGNFIVLECYKSPMSAVEKRSSVDAPSIGLVVPTRNRLQYLRLRIPLWGRSNLDEVIIVNTPTDHETAMEIRALCREYGIRYAETKGGLWDVRSKARNLGVALANTDWIVLTDDDQDVLTGVNKIEFARIAVGKDWLAGTKGDVVGIHRRESFLKFGGYPEDMVAAEDIIMSNRARRFGVGDSHGDIWEVTHIRNESGKEIPLDRARSYFWYSFTLPLFMFRTPRLKQAVIGDLRRAASFLAMCLQGGFRNVIYFLVYAVGRVLSPVHLFWVLRKSGRKGLEREPYYASWAPARPDCGEGQLNTPK